MAQIKRPNWDKIKEDLHHRREMVERDYPKLQETIKKAMEDGRWDRKIEEFEVFWKNCYKFYGRCIEVLTGLSGKPIDVNIPIYMGVSKIDLFDQIEITNTSFKRENELEKGNIDFMGLGQILFIVEQDPVNFQQEFTVYVTRYPNDRYPPNRRVRSKRIQHEKVLITIQSVDQWSNHYFDDIFIENMISIALAQLIDAIPLYLNSDIQFK